MSDQWETFCDVGYYHMWRLRRKTERGWNDGFHINTKAEAEGLCELLNKLERELTEAREQRDRYKLACDQYSEDESLCKLHEVTEQRDEARSEIEKLKEELESHAWTISPAMAQAKIDELVEQRDRLAAIARELTAMIRVNVMSGRFAECSVEQIDEHLKPWNEKIAAVKGGSDERR